MIKNYNGMEIKHIIFVGLFIFTPFCSAYAFSGSEVHITKDGKASFSGAKVMQLAGGTIFARLYWGEAYVRFTIKTNSKTKFLRATNEETTLAEISLGDWLDVSGLLESGGDTLSVNAETVKNSSVQKEQTETSGKVISVDLPARKFTLNSPKLGIIIVNTGTSTQFIKGTRTLDLEHIVVGDTITKISGEYDFNTKTLTAGSVVTYVNLNNYKLKNFEGVLQSVTGTSLPTSVKVKIGDISYTVNLSVNASVMSKNRKPANLNRFISGDTVRLYGAIREVDEPVIDATILRNMSL